MRIHRVIQAGLALGLSSIFFSSVAFASLPATPQKAPAVVAKKAVQAEKVNINTATVEELDAIKGIGKSKAKAIVAYREKHGNFKAIGDLVNVRGIGLKFFQKIRGAVTVG